MLCVMFIQNKPGYKRDGGNTHAHLNTHKHTHTNTQTPSLYLPSINKEERKKKRKEKSNLPDPFLCKDRRISTTTSTFHHTPPTPYRHGLTAPDQTIVRGDKGRGTGGGVCEVEGFRVVVVVVVL